VLDVRNDDFIRTTQDRHTTRVQTFIQDLHDKGEIYAGSYEGPYCVGCEEYKLPGDLVAGTGEHEGELVCAIHGTQHDVVQLAEVLAVGPARGLVGGDDALPGVRWWSGVRCPDDSRAVPRTAVATPRNGVSGAVSPARRAQGRADRGHWGADGRCRRAGVAAQP